MISARKQAYLEALEIPVWVRRELVCQLPDFVPAGLALGPGSGEVLMICAGMEQPSGQIASDIARALKYEPVWAWLSPEGSGMRVEEAVSERMFTTAIVFGSDVASALFGDQSPQTIHSARLLVVPTTEELSANPLKRKAMWQMLCSSQLGGNRQSPGVN